MELPDDLLGQRLHHMIQDVIDTMDMVQYLDYIGHLYTEKPCNHMVSFLDIIILRNKDILSNYTIDIK